MSVDGIYAHFMNPELPPESGQRGRLAWPQLSQRLSGVMTRQRRPLPGQKSLVEEDGKLNTSRLFGRTKGWGSNTDLENGMLIDEGARLISRSWITVSVELCKVRL